MNSVGVFPTNPKKEISKKYPRMMEYGWHDQELEDEIADCMIKYNLNRTGAINKIFNEVFNDQA